MAEFEVFVSKSDFKFSCAHFIVHQNTRERLHGHNYQLSIRIIGGDSVCSDGYLMDFGIVKKEARLLCKEINESFICPSMSPYLQITQNDQQLCMECIDGSCFTFPIADCRILPLFHSSVEELAHYLWCSLLERLGWKELNAKGIKLIEVGVEETQNQKATYRRNVPSSEEEFAAARRSPVRNPPQFCFEGREN